MKNSLRKLSRLTTTIVLMLAAAFALTLTAATLLAAQTKPEIQPSAAATHVFQSSSPAVVLIETYDEKHEISGAGSGFLVSSDGKIVTNYHVIAHTKEATVLLQNKDAYDAVDVLDIDKRKDIAVIKIRAVELPTLKLGRSAGVQVGDPVYSLGSPLGVFQNTLSEGIISGVREFDGYRLFQTTAPISHGSSGGPILNAAGEAIGITSDTVSEGQNLNFAIPIDYVKGMLAYSSPPKPLTATYEPEPKPEEKKSAESNKPSVGQPSATPEVSKTSMDLPKAVKDVGMSTYLERQLDTWTAEDAQALLGTPHGHRLGVGNPIPDIWAYDDPTKSMRQIELMFSPQNKKLHDIFLYPWNATWEDAKKLWGSDVSVKKNKDGSRFYMYKNRRLNVLTSSNGTILSIGIYSTP